MFIATCIAAVTGYRALTASPQKFDTICLIEPQKIVTFRGMTLLPKKVRPERVGDDTTYWEVYDISDASKTPQIALGECFYHPVE